MAHAAFADGVVGAWPSCAPSRSLLPSALEAAGIAGPRPDGRYSASRTQCVAELQESANGGADRMVSAGILLLARDLAMQARDKLHVLSRGLNSYCG